MKTSTKILIITALLIGVSLGAYDFKLKGEYGKGDYTNPYREYHLLAFHDFDQIKLNASTAANMIITEGPFRVLVDPRAIDIVKVRQQGKRLIVDAAFPDNYWNINSKYVIYVSCPKLSVLQIDSWYTAHGTRIIDTAAHDLNWKPTMLQGFSTDSLNIQTDHASNLVLQQNRIGVLNGTMGVTKNSSPALTISPDNQFHRTHLDILNKGQLILTGSGTPNLTYRLTDSATLTLKGAAVKRLYK